MNETTLFTIGFTKKTAEEFFAILSNAGVKRVLDIRLNNSSQLAGFAKKNNLRYFLKAICGIEYVEKPEFAPTKQILEEFKKNRGDWTVYEKDFVELIANRRIEKNISREAVDYACLLCSEDKPEHCHRRLVAEYLEAKLGDLKICHL